MRRFKTPILGLSLWLLLTVLLGACSEKSATPAPTAATATTVASGTVAEKIASGNTLVSAAVAPVKVTPFLQTGLPAALIEEQTEALPLWRDCRNDHPTLLVFSAKTINAIPEQIRGGVDNLLAQGSAAEITRRTARPAADTLLATDMGIAAALRAGYLSRVVWVVPVGEEKNLLHASFMKQFREGAAGWGGQLGTFQKTAAGLSGRLDNVPVEIVTIDTLPDIVGPLVVHIDSAFFSSYYRNEIKTPLFPSVVSLLKKVEVKGYPALAVTVSQDNLFGEISIATRFLGRELVTMIGDPTILEKPIRRLLVRGDILYLNTFFKPDVQSEKARELVALDASDAGAHYALYEVLRSMKKDQEAFAALDRAVQRDSAYLIEYLALADAALEKNAPETALALVDKAIHAEPDNPFLRLRKVDLLITLKRGKEALPILEKLQQQPWSKTFYPGMATDIQDLQRLAGEAVVKPV